MKHYIHAPEGVALEVMRRLPRPIETVEKYDAKGKPDPNGKPNVCWTPAAVEEAGELHLYGYGAFDSKPMKDPGPHDTERPLTLADVKMVDGKPTGTHRKKTPTTLQLRRRLHAEGKDLLARSDWTQAQDYIEDRPAKAAAWKAWRAGVRATVRALKAGTADPFTVTYNDPPEPLEDTIE